ncbi:RNA 2'-phosphotransferase [Pseudoalteromonas luteoviolacea]|uniref:RNA 2'-phosphotransferase n=1 Tax=Pseudoalteromonas luteoviolacea TaxID=43657 RepID=UPI001F19976F|nr:RNA 2'-phosphotransferase [Pseudoalteromonas luteoviolacea]MCF6439890.1 RNA 2'-phosphotransferase [Pseudoalteromonas luteoviolacea]
MNNKKISKYLSLVLRHKLELANLQLNNQGWALIDDLTNNSHEHALSLELIQSIVDANDKQRFAISEDGKMIRANQGHSIDVDLALEATIPPDILFHGTASRFIESIKETGLIKGQRHHVHLTESKDTAMRVGRRYGKAILLGIDAKAMRMQGVKFYKTQNQVWLVEHVPPEKLQFDL